LYRILVSSLNLLLLIHFQLFFLFLLSLLHFSFFFFFNDTATTEIYTLSLHDALPICGEPTAPHRDYERRRPVVLGLFARLPGPRSEEHTSELQSRGHLVCRLLLEKKKNI